ncbi:EthD family reductase [Flavisphingomonas formosensis]|uniref:EthD family reductase n=1 Tax=Flavisphingomonas formosensis TaxID=861534 RepID=UPI0012FB5FEE|nr:EthD family reductase [Sphingomonas formosensis]
MALLFVSYEAGAEARFDRDYYVATHLPLVERLWGPLGLRSAQAYFPASDGAAIIAIAALFFESDDAIGAALGSAGTAEILADLANFTDVAPTLSRGVAP